MIARGRACFNGAATTWPRIFHFIFCFRAKEKLLQLGRDHVAADLRSGTAAAPPSTTACFNGAATTWPRIFEVLVDEEAERRASIGPRPRGRGSVSARRIHFR